MNLPLHQDQALLRQATRADIPAMHRVRRAVRENALTSDVIGEAHYLPAIEASGRGWVIEQGGEICAFAVGNARTGNIWALFVDPAHEGRGFGRRLQAEMLAWLFSQGLERLHLGTAPGTRAEAFYRATGWTYLGIDAHGEASFEMRGPASGGEPGAGLGLKRRAGAGRVLAEEIAPMAVGRTPPE